MIKLGPVLTNDHPTSKKTLIINLSALILIFSLFFFFSIAAKEATNNISIYQVSEISLSFSNLPYYALMTSFRIFMAVIVSLIFSLIVGTVAAKFKKAEEIIIPIIDILQSIPILGYISFTLPFFIALTPNNTLGVEIAVIFIIFTSQVWNITLSLYQSIKTVPKDILDASYVFGLSRWQKFWLVEIPFAIPGIIWNIMISVSGSWFFIVASEAISIGNITYTLPGIGSYLGTAIEQKDWNAITFSILVTLALMIAYNKLIFQPLVIWARKFKYEMITSEDINDSWAYHILSKAHSLKIVFKPLSWILYKVINFKFYTFSNNNKNYYYPDKNKNNKAINLAWYTSLGLIISIFVYHVIKDFYSDNTYNEIKHVIFLGAVTLFRILVLVILSLLVLVPLGIYIGLNSKLNQKSQPIILFLASFPANLLFPIFVVFIVKYNLNPDIWLSPLIMLGAQWYILLNVIAGAATFPADLKEASSLFNLRGFMFIRKVVLPSIFPYLITGIRCAMGGAWNASIVAEAVSWGTTTLYATGLGAYIAQNTLAGNYQNISLGVCVMCLYVTVINKLVWQPLSNKAEKSMNIE